jgi:Ca2+-binding RTX toxin-like protein
MPDVSPGGPTVGVIGQQYLNGRLSGGILTFDIAGTVAGSTYDQIVLLGTQGFGGPDGTNLFNTSYYFDFRLATGYSFVAGQKYTLIDGAAGSATPEFSFAPITGLPSTVSYVLGRNFETGDGSDLVLDIVAAGTAPANLNLGGGTTGANVIFVTDASNPSAGFSGTVSGGRFGQTTTKFGNIDSFTGTALADRFNATFNGILTGVTISGGGGDDQFFIYESASDTIHGDSGNDYISTGTGADFLYGGADNDVLIGGAGADLLNGGSGIDTAQFTGFTGTGYAGVDVRLARTGFNGSAAFGDAAGDTLIDIENLIGTELNDRLEGSDGDNVIEGGSGVDTLFGYGGNDTFVGGPGDDIIDGGAGLDRWISGPFVFPSSRVEADFSADTINDGVSHGAVKTTGSIQNTDQLTNVEWVQGAGANDFLKAGADNVVFEGGAGADSFYQGSNGGSFLGGDGTDTLVLTGNKAVYEALVGVDGSLRLVTSTNQQLITKDVELFQFSNGTFTAADLFPQPSAAVNGTGGADNLFGTVFNDVMNGFDGNDVLIGSGLGDQMNGGTGNDTAYYAGSSAGVTVNLTTLALGIGGFAAGDTYSEIENIVGSDYSADPLTGGDILTGSEGANFLSGLAGNDILMGNGGGDSLDGGAGDDLLEPGTGADYVVGGSGSDTVSYITSAVGVGVHLALGGGWLGDAVGDGYSSIENVIGSAVGNDIVFGNASANRIQTLGGNDTIVAAAGSEFYPIADAPNPLDIFEGGDGNDTLTYYYVTGNVSVQLSDSGTGSASADGLGGQDQIIGIENVIGSQTGNDILNGNHESNFLNGFGGADQLNGGGGNDSLFGGADVGVVDTFRFTGSNFGFDNIGDFVDGVDKIVFEGVSGATHFNQIAVTHINSSRAYVSVNGTSGITVQANGTLTLTAEDFIFLT